MTAGTSLLAFFAYGLATLAAWWMGKRKHPVMSQVSTSDRGPVRIITLTNPPRGYMNASNAAELLVALQDALAAPEIRVIVFTGGLPGVFIRHYDVAEIKAVEGALRAGAIQPGGDRAASPVYALIDLMLACDKPTIAAINGICMGGGCEFALCCDMRIAETGDYTIGLPETRLGIIPGVGGLQLLARTVGLSRAREMVMRGRVVGPDEALRIAWSTKLSLSPSTVRLKSRQSWLPTRLMPSQRRSEWHGRSPMAKHLNRAC